VNARFAEPLIKLVAMEKLTGMTLYSVVKERYIYQSFAAQLQRVTVQMTSTVFRRLAMRLLSKIKPALRL
jgi:hypothetical protein